MARYKCPACGAPYNGRRCQTCYYEQFTEEIAHGNHTHKGEPLVIHSPVRKPIRRKDPFGCDRRTRKKLPPVLKTLITVVAIALSPYILAVLYALILIVLDF